jgi:hypothetical protein
VRADGADAFMFGRGPNGRFVSEAGRDRVRAASSLPGGVSGVPLVGGAPFEPNPLYVNLLPGWLTNEAFPLRLRMNDVEQSGASAVTVVPAGR